MLIADPAKRSITSLVPHAGRCVEAGYSPLPGVSVAELAKEIDWPTVD